MKEVGSKEELLKIFNKHKDKLLNELNTAKNNIVNELSNGAGTNKMDDPVSTDSQVNKEDKIEVKPDRQQ